MNEQNKTSPTPIEPIAAIHHITAIAGDAQANIDFYVGVLGMRMIKRTVNFDDPGTYHLYFADSEGSPGTVLTFFPWPQAKRGTPGVGEVKTTALAIAPESIGWWSDRLRRLGVEHRTPFQRFEEQVLAFEDPDGTALELVASNSNEQLPIDTGSALPAEHALRGFYGGTLAVAEHEPSARLLTDVMGLTAAGIEQNRFRYRCAGSDEQPGRVVDLVIEPDAPLAKLGAGSVHHIAFRVPNDLAQEQWLTTLSEHGHRTTPVRARQYFNSIYFREPGGVIFEFATDGPGFAIDEQPEHLGESLRLPPWLESRRAELEQRLPALTKPQVLT